MEKEQKGGDRATSFTFFSETTARLRKGGFPDFFLMALRPSLSQILSASVAAWAELSWDQPLFDSPVQSGKKLQFPPSGDSQAAVELWAPPTYSQHLPVPPAALALRVQELQLPKELAVFATCLQTTYSSRLRAACPMWECSLHPGSSILLTL